MTQQFDEDPLAPLPKFADRLKPVVVKFFGELRKNASRLKMLWGVLRSSTSTPPRKQLTTNKNLNAALQKYLDEYRANKLNQVNRDIAELHHQHIKNKVNQKWK